MNKCEKMCCANTNAIEIFTAQLLWPFCLFVCCEFVTSLYTTRQVNKFLSLSLCSRTDLFDRQLVSSHAMHMSRDTPTGIQHWRAAAVSHIRFLSARNISVDNCQPAAAEVPGWCASSTTSADLDRICWRLCSYLRYLAIISHCCS